MDYQLIMVIIAILSAVGTPIYLFGRFSNKIDNQKQYIDGEIERVSITINNEIEKVNLNIHNEMEKTSIELRHLRDDFRSTFNNCSINCNTKLKGIRDNYEILTDNFGELRKSINEMNTLLKEHIAIDKYRNNKKD